MFQTGFRNRRAGRDQQRQMFGVLQVNETVVIKLTAEREIQPRQCFHCCELLQAGSRHI